MIPGPRILIVEDDFLIRMTLADALVSDGFTVAEAADGDEAATIIAAQDKPFDLVVTDLQMPGRFHGLEIARLARAQAPDMPVIFVSGRLLPRDSTSSAFDVCIAKPYLPSEVSAAVRRLTGTASR